jgi:hypothetical protein
MQEVFIRLPPRNRLSFCCVLTLSSQLPFPYSPVARGYILIPQTYASDDATAIVRPAASDAIREIPVLDLLPSNGRGRSYPPAMAPIIMNGSLPEETASGTGASGGSCDKSSWQAKNRKNGRR